MKKNYFLSFFILFLTIASFGQTNLVTNGDFEAWDNATSPTGWTKAESTNQESTEVHGGSYSAARLGGSGTKDISQTITGIEAGASYTISLWYKVTAGDGDDARIWSNWKNGSSNLSDNAAELKGPNNAYFDNNGNQWTQYETTLTAPANADSFYFEVRSYSGSTVYWDDFSLVKNSTVTPALSITSPANDAQITTTSVDVELSVQNFDVAAGGAGDGYIKYTLDTDAAVDKFDTNPIGLTGLSIGDHTIVVELVDNAGASLSPAVSNSIDFTVEEFTQVADLAALRASSTNSFYEVTGGTTITFQQSYRNQKYIQDASGAIKIDDENNVLTESYNVGDVISGLKGKLQSRSGVLEFIPQEDAGAATGNSPIVPEVVTLADLEANLNDYESELIKIENVTFADSGNFATGTNYDISSGMTASTFRTNFYDADYIGTAIPTTAVDIIVIAGEYNGDPQVTAINLAGITLGVVKNNIEGYAVYPNPVKANFTLTTASAEAKNISVYNVLGAEVLRAKKIGNRVNVDITGLNKGIYILKVEENGKIATQKLIVE